MKTEYKVDLKPQIESLKYINKTLPKIIKDLELLGIKLTLKHITKD